MDKFFLSCFSRWPCHKLSQLNKFYIIEHNVCIQAFTFVVLATRDSQF